MRRAGPRGGRRCFMRLWAALDQLKEDQLIDAIVEQLMESVGAGDLVMMQNREGHDNADPRFYSSNDSEDSGDKE